MTKDGGSTVSSRYAMYSDVRLGVFNVHGCSDVPTAVATFVLITSSRRRLILVRECHEHATASSNACFQKVFILRCCHVAAILLPRVEGRLRNLEPELREHREVLAVAAAFGREVVAEDQTARAAAHSESLESAKRDLATAGEAHERTREREPRERDEPQRVRRLHEGTVPERRPRPRVEEVDRYFGRSEFLQRCEKIDPVLDGFAHADDPAATQAETACADEPARRAAL